MSDLVQEKNINKRRRQAKAIWFFLGIVTGFGLFYLLSLLSAEKGILYRDTTSGLFIETWQGIEERNYAFFIDNVPLVSIGMDMSIGRSGSVGLHDANNRLLGVLRITDGHFSFLRLFSNEGSPFFEMEYDGTRNRWYNSVYGRRTKDGESISDTYLDFNANGRFDAKCIFDHIGDFQGDAIYFNRSWHDADVEIGQLSAEVYLVQDGEKTKTDLIFDFEKGWIPASEATADVLSDDD